MSADELELAAKTHRKVSLDAGVLVELLRKCNTVIWQERNGGIGGDQMARLGMLVHDCIKAAEVQPR